MYYGGKEFETSFKEKRLGDLSPELVEALSIPPLAPLPMVHWYAALWSSSKSSYTSDLWIECANLGRVREKSSS